MSNSQFRFLQINTFYQGAIEDLYLSDSKLHAASYANQLEALLSMGFAAPHVMSGALSALGLETAQVVINATEAQIRWWQESGLRHDPADLESIGAKQVAAFDPDVLYLNNCHHYDSTFVRKLEKRPRLVVGWSGFPPLEQTDWSAFDVILTSFDNMFDWAKQRGAKKVIRFHPGFPDVCPPTEIPRAPDLDVVFSGSVTRQHAYRIQLLNYIGALSREPAPDGFSFGLYMGDASALDPTVAVLNRGAVWGDEMIATLRRAKIVVNIDIDSFGNQPPNMRLIEATGAGAFLLTPHHPQLPDFFTPGEEIETFRTPAELVAKLRYFLDNETEREAIALAGQKRCLRDHALSQRAAWLKEILETELSA